MRYKGIVLKLTKNRAIVTSDDFQCYYLKRSPTIYVGKEIEFSNKDIITKRSTLIKPLLGVACFLFVIICFLSISRTININNILYNPQVFAYIGVDINPSLEIEIDNDGNVLNLIPLNEDAKALVDKLKIDGVHVSKAIDSIIDEVRKSNTVNGDQKDCILISSTLNTRKGDKNEKLQSNKEKLSIIVNSLKTNIQKSGKADVYIVQADISEREVAKREGISTGRYVLYSKNKNLGKEFSFEEAKEANVNSLIKSFLGDESEKGEPEETPLHTSVPSATPANSPTPTTESLAMTSTATPAPTSMINMTPVKTPTPKQTTPTPVKNETAKQTPTPVKPPTPKQTPTPEETPAPKPTTAPTAVIKVSQYMRFESFNYKGYYIRVKSFSGRIDPYVEPVEDSVFKIVPGLADPNCISFESKNHPGYYLKHENFEVILKKYEDTDLFREDATFKVVPGLADNDLISFKSYNYPYRYIRHRDFKLYIENIDTDLGRKDATFKGIEFD